MNFNLDCYKQIFNNLNEAIIITDNSEEFKKIKFKDLEADVSNNIENLDIVKKKFEPIIYHKDKNNNNFSLLYSKSEVSDNDNSWIIYNIKKTDDYLEISNYLEKYKIIFDNLRDVIYTISEEGIITSINSAIEKITGWHVNETKGKHFTSFIHPSDLNCAIEIHYLIQKGITPDVFELNFLFKDGDYHSIEFTTVPMKKNNKIIGTLGVARDINEKKKIENQLKENELKYRELVKNLPNVVIVHTNGIINFVNDTIFDVLEYLPEEIIDKNIYDIIEHQDIVVAKENALKRLSGQLVEPYELKFITKNGSIKTMEVRASIIKFKDELATSCVLTDISERTEYEINLKEKELQYRSILDSMPDIIFLDVDGKIIYANAAAIDVIGVTLDNIIGKNLSDFFEDPEKVNLKKNILKKKITKKQAEIQELILKTDTEEFKDVQIRNSFIRFNKSEANLTVVTDITHKKRIEKEVMKIYDNLDFRVNERTKDMLIMVIELENEIKRRIEVESALRASEHRLKKVLETGPLLMYAVDNSGTIQLLEGNSLKTIGLNSADYLGKNIFDVFRKNKEITNSVKRGLSGKDVHTIVDIEKVIYESWYCPMYDNNGKISGTTCVSLDITERIESEEKIIDSLKEKEVLLKEIHHRVKNNLQIIHSLLNLQSNCIDDENTLSLLMNAKNRVRSMVLIHEKLYQSKNLASIKFNEYINELAHDLVNSYTSNLDNLKLNLELEPIEIDIDMAIPCGLIINELVTNSLKYAFPIKTNPNTISIKFFKDEKNKLNLSIADNGIGLPKGINVEKVNTLGMQLITSLSNQLNGNYKFKNIKPSGTEFNLKF